MTHQPTRHRWPDSPSPAYTASFQDAAAQLWEDDSGRQCPCSDHTTHTFPGCPNAARVGRNTEPVRCEGCERGCE